MSARRTQALILPRRERRGVRLQPNRAVHYDPNNQDSVHFMQIQPEPPGTESQSERRWRGFSSRDKCLLVLTIILDTLLSLYVTALLLTVIGLTWAELGPRTGGQDDGPQDQTETELETELEVKGELRTESAGDWLESNVTVLGLTRWTMTFSHFSLIFSLLHAVYGIMSAICDIAFFQALLTNKIRERYIATILPVHRLFFLVISAFDGLLFLFSHHIVSLVGDVFPVILIPIIGLIIMADTALILLSYADPSGVLLYSGAWRNLVILVTIVSSMVYSLVVQYPSYGWDIIPLLVFSLTSILMLAKCLLDRDPSSEATEPPSLINLIMYVTSCNVLGLFSVSTISHRLMFNYYKPILDFL